MWSSGQPKVSHVIIHYDQWYPGWISSVTWGTNMICGSSLVSHKLHWYTSFTSKWLVVYSCDHPGNQKYHMWSYIMTNDTRAGSQVSHEVPTWYVVVVWCLTSYTGILLLLRNDLLYTHVIIRATKSITCDHTLWPMIPGLDLKCHMRYQHDMW